MDRKIYESDKVRYQINNIYRKCGLKINKIKLEELIDDMIRYNYKNEKNENLFKFYLKNNLLNLKLRNKDLEKIEKYVKIYLKMILQFLKNIDIKKSCKIYKKNV